MHLLRFVHRDIKPDNIVFSPSQKDAVLCDFGISQPVLEKVGYKTETTYSGTPNFMSGEMAELSLQKSGFVDLYYNDMHCLAVSFGLMRHTLPKPQRNPDIFYSPLHEVFPVLFQMAVKRCRVEISLDNPEFQLFVDYFP